MTIEELIRLLSTDGTTDTASRPLTFGHETVGARTRYFNRQGGAKLQGKSEELGPGTW
jgi:hypothetical protein